MMNYEIFLWFCGFAVGLNHSCQSCGISFSSVSTLSAHVTYYCSKRPKSKAESYGHQPEACNGRSQSPDLPDPATDDQVFIYSGIQPSWNSDGIERIFREFWGVSGIFGDFFTIFRDFRGFSRIFRDF